MRYFILFFVLILNSLSYAQNFKITYNLQILEDETFLKNEYLKNGYEKAMEGASNLTFELITNDSISNFYLKEALSLNTYATESAIIESRVKEKTIIYNDTIYSNNREGIFKMNTYIVVEPLNKNWIITTETKKIENFTCYKATTEYIVINPAGTFKHPVIAWFCPEIPISHGPNGYGGLPGLILELQIRKVLFGAIKIENDNFEIENSLKGKKISNKDYQDKILEIRNSNSE